MKSSMLFEHGPLPPTSNLHPSDISLVIGVPKAFPILSVLMYYIERKLKNKICGRPENEMLQSFLVVVVWKEKSDL